jgi:hypothetical protein
VQALQANLEALERRLPERERELAEALAAMEGVLTSLQELDPRGWGHVTTDMVRRGRVPPSPPSAGPRGGPRQGARTGGASLMRVVGSEEGEGQPRVTRGAREAVSPDPPGRNVRSRTK